MLLALRRLARLVDNTLQIFLFLGCVSYNIYLDLLAYFTLFYLMFTSKTAAKSIHITVFFDITVTITVTMLAFIFFHKIFYQYNPDAF